MRGGQITRVVKEANQRKNEILDAADAPASECLMHQKMQKAVIRGVTPILTDIIREGIEEKLFATPYPYECVEI